MILSRFCPLARSLLAALPCLLLVAGCAASPALRENRTTAPRDAGDVAPTAAMPVLPLRDEAGSLPPAAVTGEIPAAAPAPVPEPLPAAETAPAQGEGEGEGEGEGMQGVATYYAKRFNGRRTASGVPYDPDKLTAAHQSLPFGTPVKVVNLATGREVTVVVNDRCRKRKFPFIDLSRAAAEQLGFLGKGSAKVQIIPLNIKGQ